jgi:hypothetical protein
MGMVQKLTLISLLGGAYFKRPHRKDAIFINCEES